MKRVESQNRIGLPRTCSDVMIHTDTCADGLEGCADWAALSKSLSVPD